MSRSNSSSSGVSKLFTSEPIPVVLAIVILLAVLVLALLRHFFGAISVSAGTR